MPKTFEYSGNGVQRPELRAHLPEDMQPIADCEQASDWTEDSAAQDKEDGG